MVTDTPDKGKYLPVITKVDPPKVLTVDLLREEIKGRSVTADTLELTAEPYPD